MDIVPPLLSGMLALLGGILGVLLTRRSDYERWLRQERSLTFATFLREALQVRHKAIDIIHSYTPIQQRDIEITELFMGLEIHKQIVRLYLKSNDRGRLDTLVNELRAALNPSGDQGRRMEEVGRILKEFQSIFETTLDGHHQKLWNKVVA
jgi:hypothetical protein